MKNTYSIRKAVPEDAPVLAEAEREIAKIPGRLVSKPEELRDDNYKEKINLLSQCDSGICVVVEENGIILEHAFLEPHKLAVTAHVVVLKIAIHEGNQGKGLGKMLMQHLIAWAKLGFVEEGRKTKRLKYGPSEYLDDIYMALWVGS